MILHQIKLFSKLKYNKKLIDECLGIYELKEIIIYSSKEKTVSKNIHKKLITKEMINMNEKLLYEITISCQV